MNDVDMFEAFFGVTMPFSRPAVKPQAATSWVCAVANAGADSGCCSSR